MSRAIVLAVLVAACKSSAPPPPTPSPIASASASANASAAPTEADASTVAATIDAAIDASMNEEDARTTAAAAATNPLPPLAKGAAWSVVRWDMARADVIAAFDKAGVKADARNDAKTGAERITVTHGSWNGTVYFSGGKPTYIVVTGERLSKDAAASVVAKMKDRAGAPTQTTTRTEHRWRKTSSGHTTLVIANDGTVREEYVRDGATGDVAFAKLTWGMAPAAVQQALTTAGYVARLRKDNGLDPCAAPNPPPDCAARAKKGTPEVVAFTKGDVEGTASFRDGALTQVILSGPSPDKGATRLAELEKALGKPSSSETSTKTIHADDVAKIELEVKERQPDGAFTVFETYRKK